MEPPLRLVEALDGDDDGEFVVVEPPEPVGREVLDETSKELVESPANRVPVEDDVRVLPNSVDFGSGKASSWYVVQTV